VLVSAQRQTALVAKQIATVDRLSGGRLNVSVGIGWNEAEYQGMGIDFNERTPRLEEQIEVLRLLLSQPIVTYSGRFHTFDRVGINPLPDRSIPIWMGSGGAERVLQRVARCADGWMPLLAPGLDRFELGERVDRLQQVCEEQGREPMPVWGRCYLDGTDSWKAMAEQAAELAFTHFSVGYDRFANPSTPHEGHLDAVIDVFDKVRAITG
jgi:probable F420-dependent oxidoreductase